MKSPDAMEQLLTYLFRTAPEETNAQLIATDHATMAQSRTSVAALGVISRALTGEPSMIEEEAAAFLTCEECAAALPAYVEAWLAGDAVNQSFPALSRHLRACTNCATEARALYQLLQAEAPHSTVAAPTYQTFAQARGQQQAPATALWRRAADQLFQLASEVTIVLEETAATFRNLAAGLTAQLVPATVLRSTETAAMTELLELPHAESDLLIRVRMGAVHDGVGALALQFSTLAESHTLADIKVTLRDEDGTLLESTRSDQDGLALFDELETGKYQLQMERAGQTWLVGVTVR